MPKVESLFNSVSVHRNCVNIYQSQTSLNLCFIKCGRLFLRNLAYTCCEEDLQQLFERFGPLSETYLPLDKATNKPIGLGFVTFLMPEHAVKAFNEMDGKVFQGRLLHILPSKAKETKSKVKGLWN